MAANMIAVSEKYALEVGAPTPITSERQHHEYLAVLDKLASKDRPSSDEEKYAQVLITLIEAYDLRQKDLASALGTESIVSEILRGKRELNKGQIEKLSRRFRVSPAVFF